MSQDKENKPVTSDKTESVRKPDSKNNSSTIQKPLLTQKKPGRLKGEVKLTLHTAYAQKLFLGFRPDKRSINLLQFGARMTELWDAAERDDPYADWYLLKVYDALITLQKQLVSELENYKEKLNVSKHLSGLVFTPFASQQPVVESLWFRTQYGYMAAGLVAHFDELMRTVLTANRIGVLLDKADQVIRQEWLDKLLALFRLPFQWKPCVITRSDLEKKTEQAKVAMEKMGEIPEAILSLKIRSPFSPAIKSKKQK